LKNPSQNRAGGVAQVQALSSNPSTVKTKQQKKLAPKAALASELPKAA
jgi:hypothetical protein